jgi:hypothetical protein
MTEQEQHHRGVGVYFHYWKEIPIAQGTPLKFSENFYIEPK